jgi:hypothetical protein
MAMLGGRYQCPDGEPASDGDQQRQREPGHDEGRSGQRAQPIDRKALERVSAGIARRRVVVALDHELLIDDP